MISLDCDVQPISTGGPRSVEGLVPRTRGYSRISSVENMTDFGVRSFVASEDDAEEEVGRVEHMIVCLIVYGYCCCIVSSTVCVLVDCLRWYFL